MCTSRMQRIQLSERRSTRRCAYCHGSLEGLPVVCPGCGTQLHEECVVREKCCTIGCRHIFVVEVARAVAREVKRCTSFWLWFFGVLFPIFAFLGNESLKPFRPESKADANVWWELARTPEAQRSFYLLIVWSILAYVGWLYERRGSWIRVGLFGAVLLAVAFSVLYFTTLPAAALGCILLVGALGFAPYTTLAAYIRAAIRYEREGLEAPAAMGHSLGAAIGFTSLWCLLAGGAVEASIASMSQLYAALPDHRYGSCYLATVAARGSRSITGARDVRLRDGRIVPVSLQLRRFKAFDLVLAALAPRLHRGLRIVYDRVGPPLAARVGPRTATLLHVAFVPAEAAAALFLRAVLTNPRALVEATYHGRS